MQPTAPIPSVVRSALPARCRLIRIVLPGYFSITTTLSNYDTLWQPIWNLLTQSPDLHRDEETRLRLSREPRDWRTP